MSTSTLIKKLKLALDGKYEEFVNNGGTPKDSLRNPLNLFDDSNKEDQIWLKVARDFLSKAR